MPRDLNPALATALSNNVIAPCVLVSLQFKSGPINAWSGVGDLVFNGETYTGVGNLGEISAVKEGSTIVADGLKVKLSGIGLSPFMLNNTAPPGVTLPRAPNEGEFVAFMFPQLASTDIGNPNLTYGSAVATGSNPGFVNVGIVESEPLGNTGATGTLSSFTLSGSLPDGAVITQITQIMTIVDVNVENSILGYGDWSAGDGNGNFFNNVPTSSFADIPTTTQLAATCEGSVGPELITGSLTVSNVCIAVYYTAPSNASSLINEAMNDYQMGGQASVYFALLQNGAFIGTPYLIFAGQVDQPTLSIGTQTSSITIDLESRLTNLSRPTARRYTAADQHLLYPDDIGFNWVEILQDAAFRWGTTNSFF